MTSETDAVLLKALQQRQLPDLAEAFAKAASLDPALDQTATPSLSQLLELWQATHGRDTMLDASFDSLSVSSAISIPERPTLTLDQVHGSNILSVNSTKIRKQRFNTKTAEYEDEEKQVIVTSAADKNVTFTDLTSTDVDAIYTPSTSATLCTAFSGELMASGSMNGSITLTRLSDRQTVQVVQAHNKYVVRLCFSSDQSMLASCSYDKTIAIHHRGKSGEWELRQRHSVLKNPEAILFAPGDEHLIYTQREDCYVHYLPVQMPDSSSRPKVLSFNFNETKDEHVSFSIVDLQRHPVKTSLLSLQTDTEQSKLLLVPCFSGDRIATLHTSASHSGFSAPRHAWFPDGTAVAVNSDDGLISVVDLSGRQLQSVKAHGIFADEMVGTSEQVRARMQKDTSSNIRDITVVSRTEGPAIVSVGFDKTIRITQCTVDN